MFHEIENSSRSDIRDLQNERLRETLSTVTERSDFYKNMFTRQDISPDAIGTVDDLPKIPFTTKRALRSRYPDGMFTASWSDIRRIHSSTGSTGTAKLVAYTEKDLKTWASLNARALYAGGGRPGDAIQNATNYGMVSGGLGWHYAIEELGATVVPTGVGNTQRQLGLLRDLDVETLICLPSYALFLAEAIEKQGKDPGALSLRSIQIGAEPSSRALRRYLEDAFDCIVSENYGLSEMFGSGVAIECAHARDGLHVWEDHFYPEIVDPDTGERLPEGERGELVLTSLTKEAMPLIRYRTGDLASMTTATCDCGRTHARIYVAARREDMIDLENAYLSPTEIERVLLSVPGLSPQYRIDLGREDHDETLAITVEPERGSDFGPASLEQQARDRLRNDLSLDAVHVDVVDPDSLTRALDGQKFSRLHDHRD